MKTLYYIKHKIKIALLLLSLIGVIILSMQEHENNLTKITNNCNEIFNDRLIAQGYIHKLTENSYDKKIEVEKFSRDKNYARIYDLFEKRNYESQKIITNYAKTKLTKEENSLFILFKENQNILKAIERKLKWSRDKNLDILLLNEHNKLTNISLDHLQKLSEIQLIEGKKLNTVSNKLAGYSDIFTQLNWGLVIIIGIVIQVLIFTARSTQPRHIQNNFLN
ncbi:MAG: MCP four helix bundle domain-containing protein [Bacteroidota bacterium]